MRERAIDQSLFGIRENQRVRRRDGARESARDSVAGDCAQRLHVVSSGGESRAGDEVWAVYRRESGRCAEGDAVSDFGRAHGAGELSSEWIGNAGVLDGCVGGSRCAGAEGEDRAAVERGAGVVDVSDGGSGDGGGGAGWRSKRRVLGMAGNSLLWNERRSCAAA